MGRVHLVIPEEDIRNYWLERNRDYAKSSNPFEQMGRKGSMTLHSFLLFSKHVARNLNLEKEDSVLDVGGGAGWISMFLSSLVKEITLFDVVKENVDLALDLTKPFSNIRVFHDDVLKMEHVRDRTYEKAVVSGVLVLLGSLEAVKKSMENVYSVLKGSGKAIFTDNCDLKKWDFFEEAYRSQMKEAGNITTQQIDDQITVSRSINLWFDFETVKQISREVGFKDCIPVRIPEVAWYFSFLLEK